MRHLEVEWCLDRSPVLAPVLHRLAAVCAADTLHTCIWVVALSEQPVNNGANNTESI